MAIITSEFTTTAVTQSGRVVQVPYTPPDSLATLVADLIAEVGYQVAARLEEQTDPQPRNEADLETMLAGYRARGTALLRRGGCGTA